MHDERSSTNQGKRLMTWIIVTTVLAALLAWLLHTLGIPFTPIFARTFTGPML